MNKNEIINDMEKVFLDSGFKIIFIGDKRYIYRNNCYCRITYLKSLSAFVIESADNIIDASNGVLEDGDLYFPDTPKEDILCQLKKDILEYYM